MVTTLWAGLAIGAVYAIVAIAYNIVFVATKVFNFAQAYILMIATFIAYQIGTGLGLPLWLAVIVCGVIGGLIGVLEELVAIRPLRTMKEHSEMITTLGFGVVLSGVALLIWGSQPLRVPFFQDVKTLDLLGGRVEIGELLIILAAIVIGLAAWLVSRKSMLGLAALATSEDRDAAMLRGINVNWLSISAFATAAALVAFVAPIVATKTFATFHLGEFLTVKAFLVVAIGSFGSYIGALVGGAVVGVLEVASSRYLGSEWSEIAVFVLLLVVLLVVPNGIFARNKNQERVV